MSIVLFAVQIARFDFMVDDAFISIRYADNWAHGGGLTFNPGESARVEGYTNFLFVLLLAMAAKLHVDPVLAARVLSVTGGLGCLWAVRALVKRLQVVDGEFVWQTSWLILACMGPFCLWSGAGMETTLFAALVAGAAVKAVDSLATPRLRNLAACSVLFTLAMLCRPEAVGLYCFTVAWLLGARLIGLSTRDDGDGARGQAFKMVVALIIPLIMVYLPYTVWRIHYYGDWLPNTYRAKVAWSAAQAWRGLVHVCTFARDYSPVVLLLLIGVFARFRPCRRSAFLLSLAGVYVAYVIFVGGDGLPMYRFLVPALPLLAPYLASGCILLSRSLAGAPAGERVRAKAEILAFAWVCGFLLVPSFWGREAEYAYWDRVRVEDRIEIGQWLRTNRPGAVVALNAAGAIPYYSGLRTIDMLGLNNVAIARSTRYSMGSGVAGHEKGDPDYVLAQDPDILILGRNELLEDPNKVFIWLPGDQDLIRNPLLEQRYQETSVRLPGGYFNFHEKKRASSVPSS